MRSLQHDAILTSGGSVVGTAIAAVTSVLIARELGVVDRGNWAVISSLATLAATTGSLGAPIAASYALAQASGDEGSIITRSALTAAALFALTSAALYLLGAALVRPGSVSTGVLAAGALIVVGIVSHDFVQRILLTGASLEWFVAAQLATPVVMLLLVAGLAPLGDASVWAIVLASAVSAAAGVSLGIQGLTRARLVQLRRPFIPLSEAWKTLSPLGGYALLTFGTLSLTLVVQRVDVLLVDAFRGAGDAGLYAVALQLSAVVVVIPAALGHVMFRRGSRSEAGHWHDALSTLAWTSALGAACAIALGTISSPFIDTVFGDPFAAAAGPLRLLLPGAVLLGIQGVVSAYVAARGRPKAVLIAWSLAAVFNVGANVVVVPEFGIDGAAAVSSFSYLLVLVLHIPALRSVRPEPKATS